jgi:hypothetical protein
MGRSAAAFALGAPATVPAQGWFQASLDGLEEVPAVSSRGFGEFRATLGEDEIRFRLDYAGLEGTASAAHIHLGRPGTNGGVIAFLCGGGGKPACPPEGTIEGTIVAADVGGPAAQGIAAGELDEVLEAIRAGAVYANVHSSKHPGGEIRGQVRRGAP